MHFPERSESLNVKDADFLERIFDEKQDGAIYLKGQELRRARRMVTFNLIEQGRLGDRYFGLTQSGRDFVLTRRDFRDANPSDELPSTPLLDISEAASACAHGGGPCDPQPSGNSHWHQCSKCLADDFPVSDYAANGTETADPPMIANRHWFKKKMLPPHHVYIGRGTPLGNPYTVRDHGAAALEKYKRWIWKKIQYRDVTVVGAMNALRPDSVMICSCKPRPCHGDVVQRAWIWMRDEGLLDSPPYPHDSTQS